MASPVLPVNERDIREALVMTLNCSKEIRSKAEKFLRSCCPQPNFLPALVATIGDVTAEDSLRSSAALRLKHEVLREWDDHKEYSIATALELGDVSTESTTGSPNSSPKKQTSCFSVADKHEVRTTLLCVLSRIPINEVVLQKQLESTITQIIRSDFPDKWPNFTDACISLLTSSSGVDAGLTLCHCLCRCAVFPSCDSKEALYPQVLATLNPMLTDCLKALMAVPGQELASETSSHRAKVLGKIYFRLVNISGPLDWDFMLTFLENWMQFIRAVLKAPIVPAGNSPSGDESNAAKAKKRALKIFRRLLLKYEEVSTFNQELRETRFGYVFREKYSCLLLEEVIRLEYAVCEGQGAVFLPGRTQIQALECLKASLSFSRGYRLLKEHIEFLICKVIHPLICYDEENLSNFHMPNSAEACELDTPLQLVAMEFVHQVVRLRGKEFLGPISTFIETQLESCARSERTCQSPSELEQISRQRYGIFVILDEISKRLVGKKRKVPMEQLLYKYVMPEIVEEHKNDVMNKFRATRLIEKFFISWEAMEVPITEPVKFVQLFQGLIRNCNTSEHQMIQIQSARSMGVLTCFPLENLKQFIAENVVEIIEIVVKKLLIEAKASDTAAQILQSLTVNFSDKVQPLAPRIVQALVEALVGHIREEAEQGQMALGEEGDNSPLSPFNDGSLVGIDENFFLTRKVLEMSEHLHTIFSALVDQVETFHSCVPYLFPLFDEAITPGKFEVTEQAVNMLCLVTYRSPLFFPEYWKYFERIYQVFCGGTSVHLICTTPDDDMEVMLMAVPALDNFVVRDPATFVAGHCAKLELTYKQMWLRMIERCLLLLHDSPESPGIGLQLVWICMDSFVEDITPIQDMVQPMLDMVCKYLAQVECEVAKNNKPVPMHIRKLASKIFNTALYSNCTVDIVNYFQGLGTLQPLFTDYVANPTVLQNREKPNWMTASGARQADLEMLKIFILNFFKMFSKKCIPNFLNNASAQEALIKLLIVQTTSYLELASTEAKDDSSEASSDSEQTLDDDQDAIPTTIFGKRVLFKPKDLVEDHPAQDNVDGNGKDDDEEDEGDEADDDDEEFMYTQLEADLEDRKSPLDKISVAVTASKFFFQDFQHLTVAALSQEELQALMRKLESAVIDQNTAAAAV